MAGNSKNQSEAGRLKSKSSVGDALQRGIALSDATLARLDANGAADAETVHRFRTTIRRVRSLLSSFKEVSPPGERRVLNGRLKDLAQRHAEVRQWDAFIKTLGKADSGTNARTRGLLVEAAAKRRRTSMAHSHPLAQDVSAVDRALGEAEWLHEPSPGEVEPWNERIADYAADLLDKQWRKLRKDSRRLDLSDPPSLHKFRIAAKKHRYTIEFLSSLYGKKDVKPYLQRVVALQDVLGDLRDALAAKEMLGELDVTPAVRDHARKWLQRRAAECRKRFPDQGKAFRRETPFWDK
jgi:CHAD domain-containing protein